MKTSESISEISKAIIAFHSKMPKIKKEATNPFFKNKYASLSNILEVVNPILNECGLAILQLPAGTNQLETILLHESGEFISEVYEMKPAKQDPQGQGSAITYQRRYALGAILSLNIDEDDDGNKASEPAPPKPIERKPISDDSFAKMCDAMRKAKDQHAAADIQMKQTKWYTFDDQQTNITNQIIDNLPEKA
jgi:hypothetical protein